MVFLTMASNIFPTKEDWDGKTTRGHYVELTFEAKCSHDKTKAGNPCTYKEPNPWETIVGVHHSFCTSL
jgi:hypothetical protein